MIAISCNASQTRKSQLTNVLAEIAAVNDQAALRRASQRVDATVTKVESCMLASFTEQAFLARCSSEWKQFHFSDGSSSRTHMANILNLDESYRFLRMLGLIAGNAKNGDGSELASELNRILQCGISSMACKTPGASFGTSTSRLPCSVLGFGNAHPTKYVPCLTGASGQHDVACRERLLQLICFRGVGIPPTSSCWCFIHP